MKFEHIIQVNQEEVVGTTLLTAEALWFGLMVRVQDPCRFLPGINHCTIERCAPNHVRRTLHSGSAIIYDEAEWEAPHWVRFTARTQDGGTAGTHTIRILQPEDGTLALHFHYHTASTPQTGKDGIDYAGFIREAWRQADFDTVRTIRELLAASGTAN